MQYNAPYGVSDPNAPYINGNPSTGTMGSIPPAASIEYPQREIVNLVTDCGLIIPSNSDLHQLAKAIQSGQLNFEHDAGTANAYAANMSPDPGPYFEGLIIILRVLNGNTGPSVLNLNSHGNAPVVRSDGSPLVGNDLVANTYVCFLFDGTSWRMVWSQGAVAGMPVWLTAPRDFYVNGTTGNDGWDGTSATFVSGVKGPFKTLQRAANEYPKYNLNGFAITVHVANGSYSKVNCGPANGSGSIFWIGNHGAPASCVVNSTGTGGSAIVVTNPGPSLTFDGFNVTSSGAISGDPGYGVWGVQGAQVALNAMTFSGTAGGAMGCSEALLALNGPFILNGNSQSFLNCDGGRVALSQVSPPQLVISVPVTVSVAFEIAGNVGRIVGAWGAMGGTSVNANGPKYAASGNAIINTFGGGPSSIPGTVAGTISTGGTVY